MPLSALLRGIAQVAPDLDREISGVCLDSRQAQPGDLFMAMQGSRSSGADYVRDAERRGAAAVVTDAAPDDGGARGHARIPIVSIPDLREQAGVIASRFFGEPTTRLRVVGITGTNGKSSVLHYIASALKETGPERVGVLGTLGYGPAGETSPGSLTTPDAVSLQRQFAEMLEQGIRTVVMEVSSHALSQGRVAGVLFQTAILTNLSRDHLDYHGDMNAYAQAKRRIFEIPGLRQAVLNLDDALGRDLYARLHPQLEVIACRVGAGNAGIADAAREVAAEVAQSRIGLLALDVVSPWGSGRLECALTGQFNATNLLEALGALCLLGVPFDRAMAGLSRVTGVAGRMESFAAEGAPRVVVDYAHTPDALEQALLALRPLCAGDLICVFGCGGDRDRGKRPEMGAVAERLADRVVVTSDNPRGEPPQRIIDEIVAGMKRRIPLVIEPDRARAIAAAIRDADAGDIVLVAGKGHEDYQETANRRLPFSDRQLVRNLLREEE